MSLPSLSSSDTISNLQEQIKLYQQKLAQLENNSNFTLASATPTPTPALIIPTPTPIENIFKPKQRYIKSSDILNLFKFSKEEYNNILVNIN
jgi:hypothetical protein